MTTRLNDFLFSFPGKLSCLSDDNPLPPATLFVNSLSPAVELYPWMLSIGLPRTTRHGVGILKKLGRESVDTLLVEATRDAVNTV